MRSKERPENRWKDEVLSDLKKTEVKHWTYLVKDRKAWCELVQKTKNHKGLYCQQRQEKKTYTNNAAVGSEFLFVPYSAR
jgi:hypothetical protein